MPSEPPVAWEIFYLWPPLSLIDLPGHIRGLRANDVKNHVNRLTYCFILIIRCCIYSYSNDHGADGRWNAIPSRLIA